MADKFDSNKLISIILYSVIGLLGLFILSFIYLPTVTSTLFGVAVYGGFSGVDSSLNQGDLVVVSMTEFDELDNTDIIVFELDGYGNADGLKVYKIMTKVAGSETAYRVHSSGNPTSYQWEITSSMYRGNVVSKIPNLGYVIGFLRSPIGITVILINGALITAAVILIKRMKKSTN